MDWRTAWQTVKWQILIIVGLFGVLAGLSFTDWSVPSPAAWVSDWVRLFGTVITIVAGLKLAWSVPKLLQTLADKL